MVPASPGDRDQPDCVYYATPEDLVAARELAQRHSQLEASDGTEHLKDK